MASNRLRVSVLVALVGSGLQAQSGLVAPPGFASIEGGASNSYLVGRGNLARIMDVYGVGALPTAVRNSSPLTQISLRADASNAGRDFFGKRVYLDVFVSTSPTGPQSTSRDFQSFHGTDLTHVVGSTFVFPFQASASTQMPRPFNVVLPFRHPFRYGMQPRRGPQAAENLGLVVDYRCVNKWQTKTDYILDNSGFCKSSSVLFGQGASCYSSRGKNLLISASEYTYGGGKVTFVLQNVVPKFMSFLGLSAGSLAGQTPIEVAPQTGCYLLFQPLLLESKAADSNGRAVFSFPVPRAPGLVGLPLHAQGAVYDVNANLAGYYTSRGLTTSVCGPADVCQLLNLIQHSATTSQNNLYGLAHVIRFN